MTSESSDLQALLGKAQAGNEAALAENAAFFHSPAVRNFLPLGTVNYCSAAGLALLSYEYVVAFRFDPNGGDPERRKLLGQKYEVWGPQLAELLATNTAS